MAGFSGPPRQAGRTGEPSEQTSAGCTALFIMLACESQEASELSGSQRHCILTDFKTCLKSVSKVQKIVGAPDTFPDRPEQLRLDHPALYQAAFGVQEPLAESPVNGMQLLAARSVQPLRRTNTQVSSSSSSRQAWSPSADAAPHARGRVPSISLGASPATSSVMDGFQMMFQMMFQHMQQQQGTQATLGPAPGALGPAPAALPPARLPPLALLPPAVEAESPADDAGQDPACEADRADDAPGAGPQAAPELLGPAEAAARIAAKLRVRAGKAEPKGMYRRPAAASSEAVSGAAPLPKRARTDRQRPVLEGVRPVHYRGGVVYSDKVHLKFRVLVIESFAGIVTASPLASGSIARSTK